MSPGSEFTVLLARQRSGTNALRSVLQTHPEIYCFDEVFKVATQLDVDVPARFGNYFTFLEQYCAGDIRKMFPDRHAETFAAYLAYLRKLTSKSRIVLDVKYNSTHHVTDAWREMAEPTLFTLLQSQGIGILHLTRRNLLRCLVSMLKAFESRRFHSTDGQPPADTRFSLAPQWALKKMTAWAVEDDLVATAFDGYAFYKRVDYADLFPDARGTLDDKALADLAAWFEVPNAFSNQPTFTRLSSLPLDQTIENFEDVSAVLRGTPFEACLDDEPAYQLPVDVQH